MKLLSIILFSICVLSGNCFAQDNVQVSPLNVQFVIKGNPDSKAGVVGTSPTLPVAYWWSFEKPLNVWNVFKNRPSTQPKYKNKVGFKVQYSNLNPFTHGTAVANLLIINPAIGVWQNPNPVVTITMHKCLNSGNQYITAKSNDYTGTLDTTSVMILPKAACLMPSSNT